MNPLDDQWGVREQHGDVPLVHGRVYPDGCCDTLYQRLLAKYHDLASAHERMAEGAERARVAIDDARTILGARDGERLSAAARRCIKERDKPPPSHASIRMREWAKQNPDKVGRRAPRVPAINSVRAEHGLPMLPDK